jgi:hypothetical protein
MTVVRTICTVIAPLALAALITAPKLVGADSGALSPSITGASLSADQVVDNLVRRNQERAIIARTQLNRDNYDFELVSYEPSRTGGQYVLQVSPKSGSKYVYHGKVWVDGTDFAVTHIEAEPAQNPSFWTKKSEILHEYKKVQSFWLPARNESVSYIRLGGRATLTIEYKNYRVTEAHQPGQALTVLSGESSR